jgi:hypothetical protein
VDQVALLDPYVGHRCLRPLARWWYLAFGRTWSVLRWLPTVDWAERRRFIRRVVTVLMPWTNAVFVQINDGSPSPQMLWMAETSVSAMNAYIPGPLDAPVTIINCTQKFPCRCNPMPVLLRVTDPARTVLHRVQGSHPDMMSEPGVRVTAAILDEALR